MSPPSCFVNVADPANPFLEHVVPSLPGAPSDVVVRDGYAYVAAGTAGVVVVDVEPLASAAIVNQPSWPGGDARGITVSGGSLAVASNQLGLTLYDLTLPDAPGYLTNFMPNPPIYIDDVASTDTPAHALVTIQQWSGPVKESRFAVIDLTNPSTPVEVGATEPTETWFGADHLDVDGDRAVASLRPFGPGHGTLLCRVDLSVLSAPVVVDCHGVLDPEGSGAVVVGDYAVFGQAPGAYQVLDLGAPPFGFLEPQAVPGDWPVHHDGLLYLQTSGAVLDATDPAFPMVADLGPLVGDALEPVFQGNQLLVGSFTILDNTQPLNPSVLGSVSLDGWVQGIAATNSHAYVMDIAYGSGAGRLHVIDITDPQAPTLLASRWHDVPHDFLGPSLRPVVRGDFLYAPTYYYITVYDVSNPSTPSPVNQVYLGSGTVSTITAWRDYIVAIVGREGSAPGGLKVLSLDNPLEPTVIGHLPLPRGSEDVAIHGNLAYVSSTASGLHVVSLTDPTAPALIGTVYPGVTTTALTVGANAVYGASPEGLYTVPHDCALSPTSSPLAVGSRVAALDVAPNPFRPWTSISFSLSRPGDVRLTVYDVTGRRIAGLLDRPLGEGDHQVQWDGRIRDGAAPAGVYFVRLEANGETSTRKVLRVR